MNTIKSMFLSLGLMYACQMAPSAPASSSSSPFRQNYQDQTFLQYAEQEKVAEFPNADANIESEMDILQKFNRSLDQYKVNANKINHLKNLLKLKNQEQNRSNIQTPSASSTPSISSTGSTTPHTPRFSWSPALQTAAAGLSEQEMQQRRQLLRQQYLAPQQIAAAGMSQEQMQQYQNAQNSELIAVRTISPSQAQKYNEQLNQTQKLKNNKRARSASAPAPKMNNIPESEEE